MNTDVAFQVQHTRSGAMYHAGWKSVWGPLCSVREFTPKRAQENWDRIRELWHARLTGLRKAGWGPLQSDAAWIFMRNCPPFGVLTGKFMHLCHRTKLCPFCWGRHALLVFVRACRVLYPKGEHKRGHEPYLGMRAIEFCREYNFPRGTAEADPKAVAALIIAERNAEVNQIHEPNAVAPLGSFVQHSVAIYDDHVRMCRRGLIITHSKIKLRGGKGLRVEPHEAPSRKVLAEAVGTVCTYPKQQLYCPGEALRVFLDVAREAGLRMSSFQGRMRQ
jgi:hypothetical protein